MKRFLIGTIASLAFTATAGAALPPPVFDARAIAAAQCVTSGSQAKEVVNVTFTITNYGDSGYASEWALDTVKRHLTIWHHSDGTYCAQIADGDGSTFDTIEGPSPAGNSRLMGGIKGTFHGGYITTDISGAFVPKYATHGNLGTFDAKCNHNFNCPGAHPAWTSYFRDPVADTFVKWGWIYDGGAAGTWLDQQLTTYRTGDIQG